MASMVGRVGGTEIGSRLGGNGKTTLGSEKAFLGLCATPTPLVK